MTAAVVIPTSIILSHRGHRLIARLVIMSGRESEREARNAQGDSYAHVALD
jgi:hypothetical protein